MLHIYKKRGASPVTRSTVEMPSHCPDCRNEQRQILIPCEKGRVLVCHFSIRYASRPYGQKQTADAQGH